MEASDSSDIPEEVLEISLITAFCLKKIKSNQYNDHRLLGREGTMSLETMLTLLSLLLSIDCRTNVEEYIF